MRVGLRQAMLSATMVGIVVAQRPSNMSMCDYYTTALLKENTAENQLKLLTLVVNTAVIGNYTQPNVGIAVPGILAQDQTYEGTPVNLLPYFNGMLESSNRGGDAGVSINFLDDGGAEPLKENKPSNGENSNQYKLLTHLYQYFGVLLGCGMEGQEAFPDYEGQASQYEVHKFMRLEPAEMGYFITQVGLSAASFGVTREDITQVGQALTSFFNFRCSPPLTVVPEQGPERQSMCTAEECPLADNAMCDLYEENIMDPKNATSSTSTSTSTSSNNSTRTGGGAGGSSSPTSTSSSTDTNNTNATTSSSSTSGSSTASATGGAVAVAATALSGMVLWMVMLSLMVVVVAF